MQVAARAKKFATLKVVTPILIELETETYDKVDGRALKDVLATIKGNRDYSTRAKTLTTRLHALREKLVNIFAAYDYYQYPYGDGSLSRIWKGIAQVDNATLDIEQWEDAFAAKVSTLKRHPDPSWLLDRPSPEPCVTLAYSKTAAGTAPGGTRYDDAEALKACGSNIGACVLNRFYLKTVESRTAGESIYSFKQTWHSVNAEKGLFYSPFYGVAKGKKEDFDVGRSTRLPRRGRYGLTADNHLTCVELHYDDGAPVSIGNCLNSYSKHWFNSTDSSPKEMVVGFSGFYDSDKRYGSITQASLLYAHMHSFQWEDFSKCQHTI